MGKERDGMERERMREGEERLRANDGGRVSKSYQWCPVAHYSLLS